jgi:tetratricopeptide (TPR) repeat protein
MVAFVGWAECMNSVANENWDFTPNNVPVSTRKALVETISKLENLGQSGDKKIAAAALESLALFRVFVQGDIIVAAEDARRAIALEPGRERSWDLVLGATKAEEFVPVCEKRLAIQDCARNRMLLAIAFSKSGRWDKAGEQATAVLKREPQNVVAELMLMAIAVRQSTGQEKFKEAVDRKNRAEELVSKLPEGDEKTESIRVIRLNAAILMALNGQTNDAKNLVNLVLKNDPDDNAAKDILDQL